MRASAAAAEIAGLGSPLLPGYLEALRSPHALDRAHGPAHLTASAVVLDPSGRATLLVLHRKVGLWLQPGGYVDPGDESLASAALREAREETGIAELRVEPGPVALDRHRAPCGVEEHLDVQFLVRAPGRVAPTLSAESQDVRWWPIGALPVQPVDLGPLVAAGLARLQA